MKLSSEDIREFQTKILTWYERNKRDLPWRTVPVGVSLEKRAYRVLVSEVMLQQTQVSRVIPKYEAWLNAFSTVQSLANASISDVLSYWIGLGYNRRALYLKKCAEAVVAQRGWPTDEKGLMSLPGVGKYTARALLCFAFNKHVAVVDTNVRKVILIELLKDVKAAMETKELETIADMILPKGRARDWNQALMDYASLMLKHTKIPIPKQSPFKGSNRYYRAKILKLLIREKKVALSVLGSKLREDFTEYQSGWLDQIINSLEKDGLILKKGNDIHLP